MSESVDIEAVVVDAGNSEVGKVVLPAVFGATVNDYLLFDQVIAQRASARSGTAATKTRGKVRGGGAKPWKQKGTGRARAGSRRSPIWRGGGTTFGPSPRSYAYRLPRKSRIAALSAALSQKRRDGQLKVIESLSFAEPKTKDMKAMLERMGIAQSTLIVLTGNDLNVELSARNLPGVLVLPVAGLNVYDVLLYKNLVVVRDALDLIQERLGS